VVPRNSNLLSLESREESERVVSTGIARLGLLGLPFLDETSVAVGGGLEEGESGFEGEEEGEEARKVHGPVGKAGAARTNRE